MTSKTIIKRDNIMRFEVPESSSYEWYASNALLMNLTTTGQ